GESPAVAGERHRSDPGPLARADARPRHAHPGERGQPPADLRVVDPDGVIRDRRAIPAVAARGPGAVRRHGPGFAGLISRIPTDAIGDLAIGDLPMDERGEYVAAHQGFPVRRDG